MGGTHQRWDAIIVGAGPAGSTVAWDLARRGRRALLLEAAMLPRQKPCAGWITPEVLEALELRPADYPRTIQPLRSASLRFAGRHLETRFRAAASWAIVRSEFDELLARRAEAAGAVLRDGCAARSITRTGDGAIVEDARGEVHAAKVIVGAGGSRCPVARALVGTPGGDGATLVAVESETRLGEAALRRLTPHYGSAELFVEDDFGGYGWFVTKGDFLNFGVGRFADRTPSFRATRERFLALLRSLGRLRDDHALAPLRGHSYRVWDEVPRARSGDRFLLVGDAAGCATRWAGEGIRPAVETARMAARAIDGALADGDTSAASLRRYDALTDARYGAPRPTFVDALLARAPRKLLHWLGAQACKRAPLRRRLVLGGAFGFHEVAS
jgi:geranylgeranyl reductase family protein